MKKRLSIIFIVLGLVMNCTGCENLCAISDKKCQIELPAINIEGIEKQIKKSNMYDEGYRFANAEYQNQLSAYATYYIRESKRSAGLEIIDLSEEEEEDLIEKFINTPSLDLTDLYCTVSLLEDREQISDLMKRTLSDYLDALYDYDVGCYVLPNVNSNDDYTINVYPTYLTYMITSLLDLKMKPIDGWLEEASKEIFSSENITSSNSGAYVMLLQLLNAFNFEVSAISIQLVIEMFENSFIDINDLENSTEIYLPIYLMDYLEFCILTGVGSSRYHKLIVETLCDEKGIKEGIFVEYDTYGLYATIRALELAEFDFGSYSRFNDIFEVYDSFLLNESCYIAPGYVESNFVDTYYVDAIIHKLNLKFDNDIKKYCEDNKDFFLHNGVINLYYYLELLQRNDLLIVVEDCKQDIIKELLSILNTLISDEDFKTNKLSMLNAVLKGMNILENEYKIKISEKQMECIISGFVENENKQQLVYDLAELLEFIHIVYPNRRDIIQQYCKKLERELIGISNTEISNKIMLQNKAMSILKECDYFCSDYTVRAIKDTLSQSQDTSGLFKGGDSNDDVVNYRNTYEAMMLYETIE